MIIDVSTTSAEIIMNITTKANLFLYIKLDDADIICFIAASLYQRDMIAVYINCSRVNWGVDLEE